MFELQDIFRLYGEAYIKSHKLPLFQIKAITAIESCRTAKLGGHIDKCEACGHLRVSYNSCRNRHCPKCQGLAREKWVEERKKDLLPVSYFHVVFTLPQELNSLALRNSKELYSIFFKAASETLVELSLDSKYLGAEIGFSSILHTWGQNLMYHPHIHCIIPSGGLSIDGKRWISSKKKFFIPVKVLSRKFRGKFLFYLKRLYYRNILKFVGQIEELNNEDIFLNLINNLYKKEWIVYCKPPFKNPSYVLEYLGRYTNRVAISNNRIIAINNGIVTFKWRDYKDNNKVKFMTLGVEEFIRRFLMHILPERFVKIRHYGILSNKNRSSKLEICKRLTGASMHNLRFYLKNASMQELLLKFKGIDSTKCPCCSTGKMHKALKLDPRNSSPPDKRLKLNI
jgi:hypothetical protein